MNAKENVVNSMEVVWKRISQLMSRWKLRRNLEQNKLDGLGKECLSKLPLPKVCILAKLNWTQFNSLLHIKKTISYDEKEERKNGNRKL